MRLSVCAGVLIAMGMLSLAPSAEGVVIGIDFGADWFKVPHCPSSPVVVPGMPKDMEFRLRTFSVMVHGDGRSMPTDGA